MKQVLEIPADRTAETADCFSFVTLDGKTAETPISHGTDSPTGLKVTAGLCKQAGYEIDPNVVWLRPDLISRAQSMTSRGGADEAPDSGAHDSLEDADGRGSTGDPDFVSDVSLVDLVLTAKREALGVARLDGKKESRYLFLTGATGFLGVFLLADLLAQTRARVACLVRGQSVEDARERLARAAARFGLSFDLSRVDPIPGDLTHPAFGNRELYRETAARADAVIHCAAAVSFARRYRSIREATVVGTKRVLEFCLTGRTKRLHYVSSIAVFESPRLAGVRVDESSLAPPPEGVLLGYSQTKWTTEQMVLRAAAAGLPVVVYRPPLISGHSTTGAWSESDFLIRLLRGIVEMGSAPTVGFDIDAVPVDLVSAAIVRSVEDRDSPPVLHLNNPRPLAWESLPDLLAQRGLRVLTSSYEKWLELLKSTQTAPSSALYPFRSFFFHAYDGADLTIPQLYRRNSRPRIENHATVAWLSSKGLAIPSVAELMRETYSNLLTPREVC